MEWHKHYSETSPTSVVVVGEEVGSEDGATVGQDDGEAEEPNGETVEG
jgi:hypothetical protein